MEANAEGHSARRSVGGVEFDQSPENRGLKGDGHVHQKSHASTSWSRYAKHQPCASAELPWVEKGAPTLDAAARREAFIHGDLSADRWGMEDGQETPQLLTFYPWKRESLIMWALHVNSQPRPCCESEFSDSHAATLACCEPLRADYPLRLQRVVPFARPIVLLLTGS